MLFKANSEKRINNIYNFTYVILFLSILVLLGLKFYRVLQCDFPVEMREMNVVKIADEFANGKNPYSLATLELDRPYVTNFYGLVGSLWNAIMIIVLRSITTLSSLQISQLATLFVEVIGLFFAYKAFKITNEKKSILIALFSILTFIQCFYRIYPFGGAFPDALGVTLEVFLLWQVGKDYNQKKYHPCFYALCMIILFFIKQYFVVVTLGVLLFLIINAGWKDVAKYIVTGLVGGGIIFSVVQLLFPLYFTETLCLTSVSTGFNNIVYSLKQVPEIIIRCPLHFIAIILGIMICLIRKCQIDWRRYDVIQMICMLILTIYLAQNPGANLTYYLQLWTPYIISVGVYFMNQDSNLTATYKHCYNGILVLAAVATLWAIKGIIVCVPVSAQIHSQWKLNNEILSDYSVKGEILVSPALSNYCLENDIYTFDWGQAEYIGQNNLDLYNQNKLLKQVFPYAEDILKKYVMYEESIHKRVGQGEYSLIAISEKDYGGLEPELEMGGYDLIMEQDIVTGWEDSHIYYYGKE